MSDSSLALSQQQQLRQRLVPAQVRFGRLLEMSSPEFEDEVHRTLDENPALAIADSPEADPHDAGDDFNESARELQQADYAPDDVPDYGPGDSDSYGSGDIPAYRLRDTASHTAERYESVAAADPAGGAESLMEQLADIDMPDSPDRETAAYIIGSLDANGYLTRTPAEIADDMAFGQGIDVNRADVERVLGLLRRTLEPAGIAATDLRDCLLLQLRRMEPSVESRTAAEILERHFDLFAKKHYDRLAPALDIPAEAVDSALRLIRSLNPKPGSLLEQASAHDRLSYIVPDFTVETDSDGHATVSLNGHVPELSVEESFAIADDSPEAARLRPDALAFIRSRRDEAAEFISMTRMRGLTLMAVMEAIVQLQAPFFADYDRASIRPMVLRDVQRLTGLDLSVISRATATKYVATPRGTFPLKMFFNESVGEGDDAASQHAVMEALKNIISAEDPRRPLSDARLTELLAARGLTVARRTVAKYRERLGIPVARLRK